MTYDNIYGYTPYNIMLNVSDISTGVNKFYKYLDNYIIIYKKYFYRMQIIKIKNKKKYYFYISWGRVGTAIGDNRIYEKSFYIYFF